MRAGLVTALLVAVAAVAVWAVPTGAHDSKAPRQAHHHWLPNEVWSHKHWIPYDEEELYAALGVDTQTLFAWLADDHHTIAQLARRRGVDPRTLVKRLMEPRRAELTKTEYAVLCERAERTITEGHLGWHGPHERGTRNGTKNQKTPRGCWATLPEA